MQLRRFLGAVSILLSLARVATAQAGAPIQLSERETLEARGLSVLLYHNTYHPTFGDQKLGGLELILHGRRIATNGDVRLRATPEQWDPIPKLTRREADRTASRLVARCSYPAAEIDYRIEVTPEADGLRVALHLATPLPERFLGQAGFGLEFLPTAYFGRSYAVDGAFGLFPRHPSGPMELTAGGTAEPRPLASGRELVLSPEDPLTRVRIASESGPLMLFDGRNSAQNGWFVVRTLIPRGKTDDAVVWHVRPNRVQGWVRPPVVAHSQVGYHPRQAKVAVIELDPDFKAPGTGRVLRLTKDGEYREAFAAKAEPWGRFYRYDYAHLDFSPLREPGLYAIEYAGQITEPFRIAEDVYRRGVWQPSLDTYLPVQMDHVRVREGYRIWHDASHLDDARQAPVDHTHFDGYAQGPTTDTRFKPGEHIPGLDRGGWYDAGDFDLRTPTLTQVITDLVLAIEVFGVDWDQTTVDQAARSVVIRRPDGVPDALQQVEHGVLAVLGQFKAVGHAIPGIVEPTLEQYTHLGDGAAKTDNRVYAARLGPLESDGLLSGKPDDRWAFTTRTTALQYLGAASLAAASRVLGGYRDGLARECLETAVRAWEEEHGRPPALFQSFNTTGGNVVDAEVRAAVELLVATQGGEPYRTRLGELLPDIARRFGSVGWTATRAIPWMPAEFKAALESAVGAHKASLDQQLSKNPFGVPVTTGGWGGSGAVSGLAVSMYFLHRAFPDVIGPEYTFRGVSYLLGTHPTSSLSYVSSVGTSSKLVAYGANRADYTFIPGGVAPGVVLVQPDFWELGDDWPFLWFESEYVVNGAANFILATNAADALLR